MKQAPGAPRGPGPRTIEEEAVLGVPYERARAMAPLLLQKATGAQVSTPGDGYLVAPLRDGGRVVARLRRVGPDTRLLVRVEPPESVLRLLLAGALVVLLVGVPQLPYAIRHVLVVLLLGGVPLGALAGMFVARRRRRARAAAGELLSHGIFRAFEDAVADQGVAAHYRIGPGADAAAFDDAGRDREEEEEEDAAHASSDGSAAIRRLR